MDKGKPSSPRSSPEGRSRKSSGSPSSSGRSSTSDTDESPLTFESAFKAFARFGEADRDTKDTITLRNIDKWINQSGVQTTPADTAVCFSKVARQQHRISLGDFERFLEDLAEQKNITVEQMKEKLTTAGPPRLSTQRKSLGGAAQAVTERLTDTEKYTGMHKERFDESGRGKGLEGRVDLIPDDGYVQGYKNKDTYDETHE